MGAYGASGSALVGIDEVLREGQSSPLPQVGADVALAGVVPLRSCPR